MTKYVACDYCGWRGGVVRRPGEPATCWSCRDLPRREAERDAELEQELQRYYNGEQSTRS